MPCYCPIDIKNPKGSRSPRLTIRVPCGRCIGCRLERSRQWAVRCMHEAQSYKDNSFVTFTYADDSLVWGYNRPTLVPKHLQLFWKRLRKEHGNGIRYFACGEYGERTNRPHYHACIFNHRFKDAKLFSSKNGRNLYTSDNLNSLWTYGNCTIGNVDFESAAYVARYCVKKKLGQDSVYYSEQGIEPEFVRMSLKPGIGAGFISTYFSDCYPNDYVISRGHKAKPPRYYDKLLERFDSNMYSSIKRVREVNARANGDYNDLRRLITKGNVAKARYKLFARDSV